MIWNETKECMSRDEMTNLQSARLRKLVDRVYHSVEYYRKKMQAVGLEPGDIRGIEDLERLPFTTKDDLRDTYPFGMFAVPNSQITRIHASSGTTGKATVVGYTRKDIDVWSECVARCITMAGLGKEDTIQWHMVTACSPEAWEPTMVRRRWEPPWSPCPQATPRSW